MDLSDSPDGPAYPSRASGWVTHPPPGVSRVALDPLCRHAVATTPVGPQEGSSRSPETCDRGLPHALAGSAPTSFFSGPAQRSLTLRPACSRSPPTGPFASEASAAMLPPPPLRLLPAGATVAGEELHPLRIPASAPPT